MRKRTCSQDGCNSPHRAKGLCAKHYRDQAPIVYAEFPCAVCGLGVQKRVDRGSKRKVVCSYRCRALLRDGREFNPAPIVGPVEWAPVEAPTTSVPSGSFVWVAGDCGWCGERFVRQRKSLAARYCSSDCQKAACKSRYRESVGQFTVTPSRRRRLYERDGWTCQICGEPVDREAHYLDQWAPSLDHIVPQSHTLIPDHSDDNLRTAHRWCNAVRGNLSHYTDADLVA